MPSSGLPNLTPLFNCVMWPTRTLHLHFLRLFSCRCFRQKAFFFLKQWKQLNTKPFLQGEKGSLFWNTSELLLWRNSLNWLSISKGNNALGQIYDEHMIFLRLSLYLTTRKLKCVKYKLTALCFTGLHYLVFIYNPFRHKIIAVCGTVFYHKYVYVIWICNRIYCHYTWTVK